jgi:catalase
VLFDAVVLPDGEAGVALLASLGQAREFVMNQYRHGKTILAIGASETLLGMADISATLASGEPDPGVIVGHGGPRIDGELREFIAAVGRHRHPSREIDPPPV